MTSSASCGGIRRYPNPNAIGVAVTDGAVTLTGHVTTYAQKLAAARAAERVEGVKAVANEIKVELAGMGRDDADIAAAIARILDWDVQIPEGAVHARVENGWVILAGEVGYDFQRREVERMVRRCGRGDRRDQRDHDQLRPARPASGRPSRTRCGARPRWTRARSGSRFPAAPRSSTDTCAR